jgi:hypothetical protein
MPQIKMSKEKETKEITPRVKHTNAMIKKLPSHLFNISTWFKKF